MPEGLRRTGRATTLPSKMDGTTTQPAPFLLNRTTVRKLVSIAAATLILVVLLSGTAAAQCTAETETGRRWVMELAVGFGTGPPPSEMPVVGTAVIRPLTDPADSATCDRLHESWTAQRLDPSAPLVDRHWTYYEAGDLYYVVVIRTSPPVQVSGDQVIIRLGWTPILVFDRDFQHVVTVGR